MLECFYYFRTVKVKGVQIVSELAIRSTGPHQKVVFERIANFTLLVQSKTIIVQSVVSLEKFLKPIVPEANELLFHQST